MMAQLKILICKATRFLLVSQLPRISRFYRLSRPFRKVTRKLGIYTAYFNSSAYFCAHLKSLEMNTVGKYNYYIAKNFTIPDESSAFDEVVAKSRNVNVFGGLMGNQPCPLRHGDSLQRMVAQTDNEIIVICDVDTLFLKQGWDKFVVNELETKLVVGILAYFGNRNEDGQLGLVLHPSFMAFRRSLLEDNGLDLLDGEGNDPAYKITRYLVRQGLFNEENIAAITPSKVEFPNSWFPPRSGFGVDGQASHGFCTHYNDFFLHFWHSMNFAEGRDIMADNGSILVKHELVANRVQFYTDMFI